MGRYRHSAGVAVESALDRLIAPQDVETGDADLIIGDGVSLCPELANSNMPRVLETKASAEALLKIAQLDRSIGWGRAEEARAQYLRADDAIAHKPRIKT